ncbi:MAG: response regulator [Vulcanimicrobiota bacterium]
MEAPQIRILIVEDDDNLRDLLVEALDDEEFSVQSASNAELGLALAHSNDFELVVTDIKVPGIDGLEALRRMKQERPDLESIVITGYSTEEESIRAVRLGVSEYLRKPFELPEFREAVARVQQRILRTRLHRRNHQLARDTAVWLLTKEQPVRPGLEAVERAGLAKLAAEALGFEEQAEGLELAALVALGPGPDAGTPAALTELIDGKYPRLKEVLGQLERYPDCQGETGVLVRQLERSGQQRQQEDGLLTAAYLCEVAGDLETARSNYCDLLAGQPTGRTRLEACLGLARLEALRGAPEAAQEHVERAFELARELSPELACHAHLEGGLTLARMGRARAVDSLRLVRQEAPEGSLSHTRASLALLLLSDQPDPDGELLDPLLTIMLRAINQDVLLESLWWVLPGLLRRPETPLSRRTLAWFHREAPAQVKRSLGSGPLRDEAERRLASMQAAGEVKPERPSLRFHSLGGFEVFKGEHRVDTRDFGGRQPMSVLAYLLVHPRPVAEEVLMETFWPDNAIKARRRVNQVTSSIRKTLEDLAPGAVIRNQGYIGFNFAVPHWHDYSQLQEALTRGIGGEFAWNEVSDLLEQANRLYRGPFCAGSYEDWALLIRDQLERDLVRFYQTIAERAAERSDHAIAALGGERVLELDRCHQVAALMTMEAYLAQSRPEAALRCLANLKQELRREVGLEPNIELLRTEQKALLMG